MVLLGTETFSKKSDLRKKYLRRTQRKGIGLTAIAQPKSNYLSTVGLFERGLLLAEALKPKWSSIYMASAFGLRIVSWENRCL